MPSPVSRAYVFYSNLHGVAFGTDLERGHRRRTGQRGAPSQARDASALQAESAADAAGHALRLRAAPRASVLSITLDAVHIQRATRMPLSDVLRVALESAPGGEALLESDAHPQGRLARPAAGGNRRAFAAHRVLPGGFARAGAAARSSGTTRTTVPPKEPRPVGRWFDPTSGELSVDRSAAQCQPRRRSRVKALIEAWLRGVPRATGSRREHSADCGLRRRDESALKREFEALAARHRPHALKQRSRSAPDGALAGAEDRVHRSS